ncbi:MAG TPA: tol-pal system protein YbgF [Candidatus Krumholzibacteria bacterium]|nr:tol-pal system protein YbgF [Candidatus Krumholzibacteria bacterium]HPD71679.1 tol-pal system protein YbgF [Candidatus Krumholzibacteria bacterium]HRY41388.1 tol-pal system protein YbgF [Candidatus Krumholzibacteria bacterium]
MTSGFCLRAGAAVAAVAGLGFLAACAPQLDRIELAVQDGRDEVAALRAENRRLAQEVTALGELARLESESGEETDAQRAMKLSQVSARLDQLIQKMDDNAAYLRDLSARVDLLATRSGIPTLGEYKPPQPRDESVAAELPEEGRSIYQAAQLDRSRGNVELAREGFREFLERYASSELGDDARYWLGDLAYGEQDWADADAQFQRLLADVPGTPWAAAALLKRGYCLQELGRPDEAKAVFRDLVARFPDTNEAALVRDQIE